ncbi:MAG: hypothetical protein Q9220_001467 [cf. Caloplaca sp. 1 TL-2023]
MTTREASHAGSWYTDHGPSLSKQLQDWLDAVPSSIDGIGSIPQPSARIIIAPYALPGYPLPQNTFIQQFQLTQTSVMQATATQAPPPPGPTNVSISENGMPCPHLAPLPRKKNHNLTQTNLTINSERIFLLGPSHHLYLPTVALPSQSLTTYSTPIGPLPLDTSTLSTLRSTGEFTTLSLDDDEAEHSLEMHLPYIRHLLTTQNSHTSSSANDTTTLPKLIPLVIGSTTPSLERKYGRLLAPYLTDPTNVFIISSDFAHWGLRFNYTYYLPSSCTNPAAGTSLTRKSSLPTDPPIHESIARVDKLCIYAVESGSHDGFLKVLRETGNTVCGRHPIGVIMAGLEELRREKGKGGGGDGDGEEVGRFRFVRYERSGDVRGVGESSVSYASAFAVL